MWTTRRLAAVKGLAVLALLWGFNGCAHPTKPSEPQPPRPSATMEAPPPTMSKPRPYVHEVRRPGETLISIAEWYTGSGDNWKAIAKANPQMNPNRIFIGDKIIIPENLLIRREPMEKPAAYVHKVRWPGEHISIIAQWYTGSGKNWKAIADANPKIKANIISVGDEVIIPGSLLKRRDPMPHNFLVTSFRKKPALITPKKEPTDKSHAIELFKPDITEQPSAESDTIQLFEPID